jgi:hypothetical protein
MPCQSGIMKKSYTFLEDVYHEDPQSSSVEIHTHSELVALTTYAQLKCPFLFPLELSRLQFEFGGV